MTAAAKKKKTAPGPKPGTKSVCKTKAGAKRPKGAKVKARAEFKRRMGAADVEPAARKLIEADWISLTLQLVDIQALADAGVASTRDREISNTTRRQRDKLEAKVTGEKPPEEKTPLDASDRRAFCERHLTTPDGDRFSLKSREWQQTHFWSALDGYKLWPIDRDRLCRQCTARAGTIVESVHAADESRAEEHAETNGGCRGLHSHMIWLVLLQLKRRQGKTTGFAGYAISSMFRQTRESYAWIAGSEDQAEELFIKNFAGMLDDTVKEHLDVGRTGFSNPAAVSDFKLFPCSMAGATGGGKSVVGIDEARAVPWKIVAALIPQTHDRNGWRCPSGVLGHAWSTGDLELLEGAEGTAVDPRQERYHQTCNVCGRPAEPWCGRVVAMSSAQELDGTDADWFHNICDSAEADPQPDVHVFRTTQNLNPKVKTQIVSRTQTFFSKVDGLGDHIGIETGGVSRKKGEPFLTDAQIKAVEDRAIESRDSGIRPAVGFLDTSETSELTSLVIFEDDACDDERPWHRIIEAHIKIWDPKKMGGVIDEFEVEAYLRDIVPDFGLISLRIDDRLRPWARSLIKRLKTSKDVPWKAIVRGCNEKGDRWHGSERRLAWEKFDERALGHTIRLIPNKRQREELQNARRFYDPEGAVDVREPNRKVKHLDVAEGVASCCLMVHEISQKPKRRGMAAVGARSGARAKLRSLRRGRGRMGDDW